MDDDDKPMYDRVAWIGGAPLNDKHDWVVRMVIQSGRYDINGVELFTNLHGKRNRSGGKVDEEEEEEYPDIVGVDVSEDEPVIIAEIEGDKKFKDKHLAKWKKFAALDADFYLYVPLENVSNAKELLKDIEISGLRAYRKTDDGRFYISNVKLE
ncbi:MAG: hypothetical protein V3V92_01235 [Candidatus Hydrothermarchaeales archaeon]